MALGFYAFFLCKMHKQSLVLSSNFGRGLYLLGEKNVLEYSCRERADGIKPTYLAVNEGVKKMREDTERSN